MKAPAKPIQVAQLHLPLLTASKVAISDDKQRELAVALVELLLNAAQENGEAKVEGGCDESEADC
jgi:hypothetical protein